LKNSVFIITAASFLPVTAIAEEQTVSALPAPVQEILVKRCFECHDDLTAKGGVMLDQGEIDWSDPQHADQWRKAYQVVTYEQMPPLDQPQLTAGEREILVNYLDEKLARHTRFGGTLPRRLNQMEYQNSIQTVFQMPAFALPLGFPKDTRDHGFDTVSASLVLSPPLLDAYQSVALQVADELFPPLTEAPPMTIRRAGVNDLVLSFSAATIHGDALRLASKSDEIMRSSTWPTKIEIKASGTHRITIRASAFRPKDGEPMNLEIRARDLSASDRSRASAMRLLHEVEVTSDTPETFTFEADLYEGQTPLLRWTNAELDHDATVFSALLKKRFAEDTRFLAAWQEMIHAGDRKRSTPITTLRGRNGWDILQRHLQNPDLNLADATIDSPLTAKLLKSASEDGAARNLADAYAYQYHEDGPALQIHEVTVEGPVKLVEGPKDQMRRTWREWSFGTRKEGETDEAFANRGLGLFLPRLFRRAVDEQTRQEFLDIAKSHWAEGHAYEEGMHLALRNALVSPRFLYREMTPGKLDQADLASRLAYFLTRNPPTSTIIFLVRAGELSDPETFRKEAERLLPTSPSAPFIRDFTSQWLHTRLLPEIMPDETFAFSNGEIDIARAEAEHFFFEMLDKNLPLSDFVNPDFLMTSKRFASENYDYPFPKTKFPNPSAEYTGDDFKIERLPIERGGRRGGLLGMAGVMMATANGVDTQPVLRGVWVLENVMGTPLPPIPSNIPALTPDVQGAKTPRDLLTAHTQAADCRGCHRHIDPVGFALENFDPVGKWRETWPKINTPINPSGTLPDGTRIEGFIDFKKWLASNTEKVGECLSEKLMIYATGRIPSYAEQKEIAGIVATIQAENGGFRDLLLALVDSRTFRTR